LSLFHFRGKEIIRASITSYPASFVILPRPYPGIEPAAKHIDLPVAPVRVGPAGILNL
jgi:hypothetical protein